MIKLPTVENPQVSNIIDSEEFLYFYDYLYEAYMVKSIDSKLPYYAIYGIAFETFNKIFDKDENYFLDMYLSGKWDQYNLSFFLKYFRPEIYKKYKILFD